MLMRGYTLFEESFYKDNKDLLEFIRIKRFYKNNGRENATSTEVNKSDSEVMKNNKRFLPKIDSNLNQQDGKLLRKRINSPTYRLLCDVNEKFKTLGYRLSPTLPRSRETPTSNKHLSKADKGFYVENTKRRSTNNGNDMMNDTFLAFDDKNEDVKGGSEIEACKQKLEIWLPRIVNEEVESETLSDVYDNEDGELDGEKKKKPEDDVNKADEKNIESNRGIKRGLLRNRAVLTKQNSSLNLKNKPTKLVAAGYGLRLASDEANKQPSVVVTSAASHNITNAINSSIQQSLSDELNPKVKELYPLFMSKNKTTEGEQYSNLDFKKLKENSSLKQSASFSLTRSSTKFTPLKSSLVTSVVKEEEASPAAAIPKPFNLNDNDVENGIRIKIPAPLPPICSAIAANNKPSPEDDNNLNEQSFCTFRLSRITEPGTKSDDIDFDDMLSNKRDSGDVRHKNDQFSNVSSNETPQLFHSQETTKQQPQAKFKYSKRVIKETPYKYPKVGGGGMSFSVDVNINELAASQQQHDNFNMVNAYLNRSFQNFNEPSLGRFSEKQGSSKSQPQQQPHQLVNRSVSLYNNSKEKIKRSHSPAHISANFSKNNKTKMYIQPIQDHQQHHNILPTKRYLQ